MVGERAVKGGRGGGTASEAGLLSSRLCSATWIQLGACAKIL